MLTQRNDFCYKHNKEKSGFNLNLWCNDCDNEAKNLPQAKTAYPTLSLSKYTNGQYISVVGQLESLHRQNDWKFTQPGCARYHGSIIVQTEPGKILFRVEDPDQVKVFESMPKEYVNGLKLIKISGIVTHQVFYDEGVEDDIEVSSITFQP